MPGETVDRKFSTVEDTREFKPVVARDLPRPVCDDFDYRAATDRESLRQALLAADRRDVGRSFGLRQVREIAEVRDLASEIDLGVITVATDSAALLPSQVEQLRQMGLLMRGPRPTIRPSCSSSRSYRCCRGCWRQSSAIGSAGRVGGAGLLRVFRGSRRNHGRSGLWRTLPRCSDPECRTREPAGGHSPDCCTDAVIPSCEIPASAAVPAMYSGRGPAGD